MNIKINKLNFSIQRFFNFVINSLESLNQYVKVADILNIMPGRQKR